MESPLGSVEIWSVKGYRFTVHESVALAHKIPIDGTKTLLYTPAELAILLRAEYSVIEGPIDLVRRKKKK